VARLVTGPVGFFVAGVIDVLAFWVAFVREAAQRRVGSA
jgi:hypothetical protein